MAQEITALKAQKKNPNRINIYLDGEYAFGLARIVAAWLKIGQILSDQEIENLKNQDNLEVAYQKGLQFLSFRSRSETEMRRKFAEQGLEDPVIEATLKRLKENGFLGDEKFARDWVENRSTFRPRGKRMLALELRQKGIAEEEIEKALDESGDENSLAYQAAIGYVRRLAGADWETFRKRLGGFLVRRGFTYGTVLPVLQQVWDETHSSDGATDLIITEDEEK